MGNKQQSIEQIEHTFKWSDSNTKMQQTHTSFGKMYAVDARRIGDTNEVMIATADASGQVVITKGTIQKKKNNKIQTKFRKIQAVPVRSAWIMAIAFSPTTNRFAVGGLDNLVSVYDKNDAGQYGETPWRELQGHAGYVSGIKWIEQGYDAENLLLSCSGDGTVRLWNIDTMAVLLSINVGGGDVESVDHVYIENRHIIAFGDIAHKVYLRDITDSLPTEKNKAGTDSKEQAQGGLQWKDFEESKQDENMNVHENKKHPPKVIFFDNDELDTFNNDVNAVAFNDDGSFLAATSDDSSYRIYRKNCRYDVFWDAYALEWTFLCQRKFEDLEKDCSAAGIALTWVDNNTLMVGTDESDKLFCTHLKKVESDPKVIDAVKTGIQTMIESLPNMRWTGLVESLTDIILFYLSEVELFDYCYKFGSETRASCMAHCKWGNAENDDLIAFGAWDKKCRVIIAANR